jgi:hypothetical protein
MDLRETGYEDGSWIKLTQECVHSLGEEGAAVNLPTAVLYDEFHNICHFMLKKEMLLFLHYWSTAQWI